MPIRRTCTRIVLPVVLLTGLAAHARAQMFITTGRDTLRGLPGVEVAVEPLEPEFERGGLVGAAIQSEAVQRLRAAGITVYASQNENPSEAKPYLYVDVTGVRLGAQNVYAIAVQVQVRQTLRSPVTSSNIVDAMTWDARTVLVVPGSSLASVRATIHQYVDHFIEDWRAVHR
ncbi:MAG TPA: hypothetical protein VGJ78_24150 [Vicinamibacterales bacterium]|jgi:hypothetical protein